ncbi:MAG: hypothetical protein F6J89_33110 [Symploca sp. SIO1C4]|uniref:Uncharacterized protein n=1 Tax=Symploca sp. SIO1C4 TaxID=2607765 RepID=A0A6B3NS46_9CYAN|nr:hypothetical protein [Symploca sp. SIO1C4]
MIAGSQGLGIKSNQKPVCVMLPPSIDTIVKAMPNRSEFMRAAVIEKLERDGLLGDEATEARESGVGSSV